MRAIPLILFIISFSHVRADEGDRMCLILSGENKSEFAVGLENFRRIRFSDDRLTLSNPDDDNNSLELLYSEFNRLTLGVANPSTAIENTKSEKLNLLYCSRDQVLTLSPPESSVTIGVFSLDGKLLVLSSSGTLSVASLASGSYVAIAISKQSKQTLKFTK